MIQPGGRLNLNNATLTALNCGTTWKGVRVWGNHSLPQTTANQGYLNMQNNATISHAEVGAATWNKEAGSLTTSGGFIQTLNARFTNNKVDLEIPQYPSSASNPSNNFFDNTQFVIDDNYRFGNATDHRAKVSQIYRVLFRGCTFANDATAPAMQAFNVNNFAGILIFDAFVGVDRKVITGGPTTPTVFRSLYQGINASKGFTNQVFTVTNTQFTQNQMGVLSTGIDNFSITNNIFSVGNNPNFFTNTGIFVNTGTGFTIRDNSMTGFGNTVNTLPISYGVVVKNTCSATACANNSIFRNTFNNLCFANQAEGRNRETGDNGAGLVYFCNNHSNDLVDIRVLRDPALGNVVNQGVRMNHFTGSGTLISVQNTFSQNAASGLPNPWYDIYLDNTPYPGGGTYLGNITYVPQTNVGNTYPYQSPQPPLVPYVNDSITGNAKNCSNANPFSLTIGQLLSDNGFGANSYEDAKASYLNAKYLLHFIMDGGNKEGLKQQIDYQWSDDAWQLRTNLLQKSPNLSEEVVLHVIDKNVLPPALLFEVLQANLHLMKSNKFIAHLKTGANIGFPEYMVDLLLLSSEPESQRKLLEQTINNSLGEMSAAYQAVVSFIMQDTTDRENMLVDLLTDVPLKETKLQLTDYFIGKGNKSLAINAVNDYLSLASNEGAISNEVTEFYTAVGLYHQQSQLDTQKLFLLAADSAHAYNQRAISILKYIHGSAPDAQPLQLPITSYKKEHQAVNSVSATNTTPLKLYPNPAKNYITIEFDNHTNESTFNIELLDNAGRVIQSSLINAGHAKHLLYNLSLGDLPSGYYFMKVKTDSKIIGTGSFTVE